MRHPGRLALSEAALSVALTFVAGNINAGVFLLVGQYTSHMSGLLSATAEALALGLPAAALAGLAAVAAFMAGAGVSAILVNRTRRRAGPSPHALPLALEATLLLGLGLRGGPAALAEGHGAPIALAVLLLCFAMGLQNATITKISGARIRTTHMTGVVTDLGIELGKLLYRNGSAAGHPPVRADRAKLRLLGAILLAFILGGVAGALAFPRLGFAAALPLALLLLGLARASWGRAEAEELPNC